MNKLDLINLLEEACGGRCNAEYNPCAYKEAACELRDMEPVAWKDRTYGNLHHQDWGKNIPLYTLGDADE